MNSDTVDLTRLTLFYNIGKLNLSYSHHILMTHEHEGQRSYIF